MAVKEEVEPEVAELEDEPEWEEEDQELEDSDDPVVLKADKAKLQAALDKERQKSARLKSRVSSQPKGKESESDDATTQIRAEALKEIIQAKAEAALAGRGVKHPERLVRLANLNAVERTEDGSYEGLDDALDELEEDYPEFFPSLEQESTTPIRTRANGSNDGARKGVPPKKNPDAFEAAVAARFGRRR